MSEIIDAYVTPGTERETRLDTNALLQQMDEAGVSRAVIVPEDREIAVANESGNHRIRRLAKEQQRLIPACSVNPWFGSAGHTELRRMADEGVRMLVISPALQGFVLGDPVADELFKLAGDLKMLVYVHTGPHSSSAPSQLALVAQRLPRTRFICGHCGSTDYWHDMPAIFQLHLENLWFELSFVRPWSLPVYASVVGDSRLIYGSGAPRNDLRFELEQFSRVWPIEEHRDLYGGTLLRLLSEAQP